MTRHWRLAFHYRNQPSRKQQAVLAAIVDGAGAHGDYVYGIEGFERVEPAVDGAILFGIGGIAKSIYDGYRLALLKTVLIDKGYERNVWHRVAVNEFQPLAYLQRKKHPEDRFRQIGVDLLPYRNGGDCILLDGASNKFARWKELGDYHAWGASMVAKIRQHTELPVIYRPRPTHNVDLPVDGAEFSRAALDDDLARAAIVVSYGGNIGWDAAIRGIPHFAIGDSIARPISETDWSMVGVPRIPTEAERYQWGCDVAYQQWTLDELRSGEAWAYIREVL